MVENAIKLAVKLQSEALEDEDHPGFEMEAVCKSANALLAHRAKET